MPDTEGQARPNPGMKLGARYTYHGSQIQAELIFVEGFSVTVSVTWGKGGDVTPLDKRRDGQEGMWDSSINPHHGGPAGQEAARGPLDEGNVDKPLSASSHRTLPCP